MKHSYLYGSCVWYHQNTKLVKYTSVVLPIFHDIWGGPNNSSLKFKGLTPYGWYYKVWSFYIDLYPIAMLLQAIMPYCTNLSHIALTAARTIQARLLVWIKEIAKQQKVYRTQLLKRSVDRLTIETWSKSLSYSVGWTTNTVRVFAWPVERICSSLYTS